MQAKKKKQVQTDKTYKSKDPRDSTHTQSAARDWKGVPMGSLGFHLAIFHWIGFNGPLIFKRQKLAGRLAILRYFRFKRIQVIETSQACDCNLWQYSEACYLCTFVCLKMQSAWMIKSTSDVKAGRCQKLRALQGILFHVNLKVSYA